MGTDLIAVELLVLMLISPVLARSVYGTITCAYQVRVAAAAAIPQAGVGSGTPAVTVHLFLFTAGQFQAIPSSAENPEYTDDDIRFFLRMLSLMRFLRPTSIMLTL